MRSRDCKALTFSHALQLLYVWDLDQSQRPGGEPEAKRARGAYPPQLLFTHAGHRASVSGLPPTILLQNVKHCAKP